MIRLLLTRIILPLLLFLVLRWILKSIGDSLKPSGNTPQRPDPQQAEAFRPGGELKKDPVCGTYVSASGSLTRTIGGEVYHFCSAECRDKYRVTAGA